MFSRVILASAVLATALLSVHGQTSCIGDVVNPSFESCQDSGQPGVQIPTGWTQSGSGSFNTPTVYCSTAEAHTGGNKSAVFVPQSVTNITTGATTYTAQITQSVPLVESGQPITLTYWVKYGNVPPGVDPGTSGTYRFNVFYNYDMNSRIEVTPTYVAGTGTPPDFFYQYRATFLAPSNSGSSGTITIGFETTDSRIFIYLDDVQLISPCITGDPQFVGLRGQSYQVHGIDGEVYNLVSSTNTQINSRFTFLTEGKCPVVNDVKATNCWSHPGSYLGAVGVQQRVGDKLHQLSIASGDAATGFAAVELDGEEMAVGDAFADTDMFTVNFASSHQVTVQVEEFILTFDNSDEFINQATASRVSLSKLTSHGLFGQTHQRKIYRNALRYIEGEVDDYLVSDNDLFGSEFVYNRFRAD